MTRRYYWWICAHDPDDGKPYLVLGSDKSEDDCRQHGIELLGGLNFEIKRFPTRDIGQASALYRGKRLEDTHSLDKAKERLGHEKSILRMQRKSRARENKLY